MIRALYYTSEGGWRTDLQVADFSAILQNPLGVLWVDFENTVPSDDEPIMRQVFDFHPLAIDDALQESHVPKIDDWDNYLYIVLHAVSFDLQNGGDITTHELDIFLGKNYVVTHHDDPIQAVDRVWAAVQRDDRYVKNGADRLLYRLTDEVIASFMPVIDEIDDAVDRAEDQIFDKPDPLTLEHIFTLKRATLHLRRIIGPQREVLNKMARDDYAVIDARERIYFRDIYDHLVRLYDITESIRDLVGGALDTYLSVVNNRMNDIMKTLTVITTLFMPISFIASFFGMNFFQPVAALNTWTDRPVFILVLLITISLPVAMFFWIRRRGWM